MLLLAFGGLADARAQGSAFDPRASPLRPSISTDIESSPASCGTQARLYAAGGLRVWVTRQGTVEQDNPLRPLAPDKLLVLQVAVNGRLGTAFGPDFDNMRQAGSVQTLEQESGRPVRWSADGAAGPTTIRIVAEDGRVLLGPLAFRECGPAPRTSGPAPVPSAAKIGVPARRATDTSAPDQTSASRPGLPLPQGAIQ